MTKEALDKMLEGLIDREGGYVNDPDDPGGETKYGISKKAFPDVDIKNLSRADAKQIYSLFYWYKNKLDLLPDELADFMLDWVVHSGANYPIKELQRLVGCSAVDGVIGKETLGKLSGWDFKVLLNTLVMQRVKFLGRQVSSKPAKLKYLNGWLNRAFSFIKLS